jgi:Protein of unknown function (DUF2484)
VILPLGLCFLWLVAVNVIGMLPSRDYHWRAAYGMIALGLPLLAWVTYEGGVLVGLVILAGAASVLRWPVVYFWRWLRRKVG